MARTQITGTEGGEQAGVCLGRRAGGAGCITDTPLNKGCGTVGVTVGLWRGVWTPEKSPMIPKCVLPSRKDSSGGGDSGAGGRSTVTMGGVSLSDTEQTRAPDLTNLLWVLQIELYSLLRALLLGGAGLATQSCRLWEGLFVAGETSLDSTFIPSRSPSIWCWPNTTAGLLDEQTLLLYD